MVDYRGAVAITSIIIYAIILPQTVYALARKYFATRFPWLALSLFVTLRIVGNAFQLALENMKSDGGNKSLVMGAAICNTIGLGPLLLASTRLLMQHNAFIHVKANPSQMERALFTFELCTIVSTIVTLVGGVQSFCSAAVLLCGQHKKAPELNTSQTNLGITLAMILCCYWLFASLTLCFPFLTKTKGCLLLGMEMRQFSSVYKLYPNGLSPEFIPSSLYICVMQHLLLTGLVSYAGYDIVNPEEQQEPNHPDLERTMWYQHLFQHERGKQCLSTFRRDLCYRLWQEWSPSWPSIDQVFSQTETSFDNPDFVDVVIHAYRYALGTVKGDPSLQHFEDKLAARPKITVPTITLDGTRDPLKPGGTGHHNEMFSGHHERREFNVGHAFPLENPVAFAEAVIDVHNWTSEP